MSSLRCCLIVNVRDGEKYLHECLQSLTEQTFRNFDIFVFDNQSSDNTKTIVEHFTQKFEEQVKYIPLQKYLELPQARNFALSYIKNNHKNAYTHFSFCDADDMWDLDWLMNINEKARNDAIIYTHGFELIGDRLNSIYIDHHIPKYSIFSGRVNLQGTVVPFGLVKNESFFDESFCYCYDVDKWNELYELGMNFVCVNKKLFYYRIHDGSLSASGFSTVMRERWGMTNKYSRSRSLFIIKFIFYFIKHWVINRVENFNADASS